MAEYGKTSAFMKTRRKTPRARTSSAGREVMDIRSLSAYLGMGKSKIYALIRMKKIPASRIGRQYRFSKEVIDQWLKEKLITQSDDVQMTLFSSEPAKAEGQSPL